MSAAQPEAPAVSTRGHGRAAKPLSRFLARVSVRVSPSRRTRFRKPFRDNHYISHLLYPPLPVFVFRNEHKSALQSIRVQSYNNGVLPAAIAGVRRPLRRALRTG